MTEPYAKAQPELVQRMIDEGHEIGNHSVTHPSEGLPSQSLEQQKNEVMENHQYIKDNFGYDMHLFRFPGRINSVTSPWQWSITATTRVCSGALHTRTMM